MSIWKIVKGNIEQIEVETPKAMLLKVPGTDWLYWHPKKLIRQPEECAMTLNISFTDEFKFKLMKFRKKPNGDGFQKMEELTVTPARLQELYMGKS